MLVSDQGQGGSVVWARQDVCDAPREGTGDGRSGTEHINFSPSPAAVVWGLLGDGRRRLCWVLCFLLTVGQHCRALSSS